MTDQSHEGNDGHDEHENPQSQADPHHPQGHEDPQHPEPAVVAFVESDADDLTSLDGDSAFGASDSGQSDDTSLASSIRRYREENGRTYANYGNKEYWQPNDEGEQDRMDMLHHFHTLLLGGKLLKTKVGNVGRVLDLGTGTGIWAMDFADAHPGADVKGIDVSPIQPLFVPSNCRFEIDDYNQEFYDDDQFDLIHIRDLHGSMTDPRLFYERCYGALAPGGYIDITEMDPIDSYSASHDDKGMSELLPEGHPIAGMGELFVEACNRAGVDGRTAPKIEGWLKEIGFENIKAEKVKVPVGTWPKNKKQKEIGAWNLLALQDGLIAVYMRLGTTQMGLSQQEVHVMCARVREALRESKWQIYINFYFISAQKPR